MSFSVWHCVAVSWRAVKAVMKQQPHQAACVARLMVRWGGGGRQSWYTANCKVSSSHCGVSSGRDPSCIKGVCECLYSIVEDVTSTEEDCEAAVVWMQGRTTSLSQRTALDFGMALQVKLYWSSLFSSMNRVLLFKAFEVPWKLLLELTMRLEAKRLFFKEMKTEQLPSQ